MDMIWYDPYTSFRAVFFSNDIVTPKQLLLWLMTVLYDEREENFRPSLFLKYGDFGP